MLQSHLVYGQTAPAGPGPPTVLPSSCFSGLRGPSPHTEGPTVPAGVARGDAQGQGRLVRGLEVMTPGVEPPGTHAPEGPPCQGPAPSTHTQAPLRPGRLCPHDPCHLFPNPGEYPAHRHTPVSRGDRDPTHRPVQQQGWGLGGGGGVGCLELIAHWLLYLRLQVCRSVAGQPPGACPLQGGGDPDMAPGSQCGATMAKAWKDRVI